VKPFTRKRTVTLADVGQAAGVSPAAASSALNDRPGVSDATRVKVRRAADELGWFPHARGRALAYSRAFTVGIVHARPAHHLSSDPFFASFLAGVEESLAPADTGLLLSSVRVDVHGWARAGAAELLALIDGRPPRAVALDAAELVLRGSTAALRGTPRDQQTSRRRRSS
jgi:DNA-binding LacI/PurR family transcriptional regulator